MRSKCGNCDGHGSVPNEFIPESPLSCYVCRGSGEIELSFRERTLLKALNDLLCCFDGAQRIQDQQTESAVARVERLLWMYGS